MSKKSKFIYIPLLCTALLFFNAYMCIPSDIRLTQNSEYTLKHSSLFDISANVLPTYEASDALLADSSGGITLNTKNPGNYQFDVKLFNFIPVKTVDVMVSPEYSVIPSGAPVGIKLYSDGLLIINVADVTSADGARSSPAEEAGLCPGDRIISANGRTLTVLEELSAIVNSADGELVLRVMHGDSIGEHRLTPALSADGTKKIGIWVRDSTAGVGTLTFVDPASSSFAALGHAITDIDTGDIILPKSGSITDCRITSATKGKSGTPGELSGIFEEHTLGNILLNSQLGIYGKLSDDSLCRNSPMPVATRFQVRNGAAYIMADVDGGGVKKYNIEIEEVSKSDTVDNKGLIIQITDPTLLEKTGGIVQGMSGSPIIQNGMLVGAVTHVFVNDPTRGYGIFAENMLNEAKNCPK